MGQVRRDAVYQGLGGGGEVGGTRFAGVIRGGNLLAAVLRVRAHQGGGAAVEVFVGGEVLADQGRADRMAVADEQAAIGLEGEGELADADEGQRHGDPGQQGEGRD